MSAFCVGVLFQRGTTLYRIHFFLFVSVSDISITGKQRKLSMITDFSIYEYNFSFYFRARARFGRSKRVKI